MVKPFLYTSFILFLWLNTAINSYAFDNIRFKTLTIDQGLPSASIHAVLIDHLGFLWIGAEGVGAVRYDGKTYKVNSNIQNDSSSISNNFIERIIRDKHNRLWFATQNGLNLYNYEENSFIRHMHSANNPASISGNYTTALIDYKFGSIWVATNSGVSFLDEDNNRFFHVSLPDGKTNFMANVIVVDNDDNIWIGTSNYGLLFIKKENIIEFLEKTKDQSFNPAENRLFVDREISLSEINKVSPLLTNSIFSLVYEPKQNLIWIGTDNGLLTINKNFSINRINIVKPAPEIINHATIRTIALDYNNNLWLGTTNEGLITYNIEDNKFAYFNTQNPSTSNLTSNSIRFIYVDNLNNIWITTKFGGINLYDVRTKNFSHITRGHGNSTGLNDEFVMAVHQDKNRDVWFGTKQGALNKWDINNNTFKVYRYNKKINSQNLSNRIHYIKSNANNKLYLGISNSLELYDPVTDISEILLNKTVYSFDIDQNQRLWVATEHGVHVFCTKTNKEITSELSISKELLNNDLWILKIICDSKNRIWMGGQNSGLWLVNNDRQLLTNLKHDVNDSTTISGNMIRGIMEDSHGNIWIGTKADGLNKYIESTMTFKRLDNIETLNGITVYSIEEDDLGCFWMGTHDGIIKFCSQTNTAERFSINYGLQGKIFEINAHCKLTDGRIIFGGQNGFNIFNPHEVLTPNNNSSIIITELKIFDIIKKKDIDAFDTIYLNRKDNYISFEFALLDYSSPESNKYAYKLTNIDKGWVYSRNRNFVSYTNIPPGE